MALEENNGESRALVLSSPDANEPEIRQQLESVLPFAKYDFTALQLPPEKQAGSDVDTPRQLPPPLSALPIRIESNLYHAERTVMPPEMGAAGAPLLAWTILKNLGGKTNQEKG